MCVKPWNRVEKNSRQWGIFQSLIVQWESTPNVLWKGKHNYISETNWKKFWSNSSMKKYIVTHTILLLRMTICLHVKGCIFVLTSPLKNLVANLVSCPNFADRTLVAELCLSSHLSFKLFQRKSGQIEIITLALLLISFHMLL